MGELCLFSGILPEIVTFERNFWMKQIIALSVLLSVFGCNNPDGRTWLIRTTQAEITVSEAGDAWNALEPSARQGFMSGNNPVGDFVSTLGKKTIIMEEISNDDYLYSDRVQSIRKCWLRNSTYIAYTDSLEATMRASVSQQDLLKYRELIGTLVWYTDPDGIRIGPERLPDLDWDLAFAFDTMSPGQTINLAGEVFTLDSTVTSPDSMIQVTLADTSRVNSFALSSLADKRSSIRLDAVYSSVLASLVLDSTLVTTYCTDRNTLQGEEILASWDGGSLSVSDLDGIAGLTSMGSPVGLDSPPWVYHNLRNHAKLMEVENLFSELYPDEYSVFVEKSNDFAASYASDLLFSDEVLADVDVTDDMILEAFENIDSIPTIPETRTFESVILSAEEVDEAIAAAAEGADADEFDYPGYTRFLAPNEEHISRPVTASLLPKEMGTILFMLEEHNREWQRPIEAEEGLFVMYRLDSIIAPHQAELEDIRGLILTNLTAHLREQATMEWLRTLEESHELMINSDILEDLPGDPSMWSDL